ncbi:Foie gras liver health family 1-domain-containing protein [Hysterangium stoloniferum]|nr:Foie gras liver health family 1-domain-containing protein [Hysterangium stoloniferum]
MNSYPSEFLMQLGPVMFIAGLDTPVETPPSDTETSEDDRILGKRVQDDPFILLTKRLRDVLLEKSAKKGTIWVGDAERTDPAFRMILVDKSVRFPPQKASGQDAHSPLSPLTQTSPLYPDGLIAPVWIRKHTELLPAVFVLFLRLYERSEHSPLTPISPLHSHEERHREEEKRRDIELSAEIAARKRICGERGIKLTAVLLASRRMLDDPNLDSRLTFIRRQSGLDSRAALFVLSPVNSTELQEFVKSLQSALREAALEYYTHHSKRVRRKRNKHTASLGTGPAATPQLTFSTRALSQPLRTQGWIARYEYKMACFAEFRGEEEVARKHFQTSWEILLDMFGSTVTLPPRTKRWAEAKVLADCISVKIIKLYLYRGEYSRAMAHFAAHMSRFADFSRGWGIGEETWEFWSWMARWYKILAELLDMATTSNLKIPQSLPNYGSLAVLPPSFHQLPGQVEPSRPLGINPTAFLQHPGFYYYAAALCTQRRLEQFITANQEATLAGVGTVPINLANERKVDHKVIILELCTKAYELFKKHSHNQGQSRFTFYIACRIAQTYRDSGKFEMAIKFFERIAKTYRKEEWGIMLKPVLSTWYTCSRQVGDVDSAVKLLIEMMCCGNAMSWRFRQLEEDLAAILETTSPTSTSMKIDLTEYNSLFHSSCVFWQGEVDLSQRAPFQLHLKAPNSISLAVLPFVSLRIEFSGGYSPVFIKHRQSAGIIKPQSLQLVQLGFIQVQSVANTEQELVADLQWSLGSTMVLTGSLASDVPINVAISRVILTAVKGNWDIELTFSPSVSRKFKSLPPRWLSKLDPPTYIPVQKGASPTLNVRHRPHRINVDFSHPSPAYLNEHYPITLSLTNIDEHELTVIIDTLLQPPLDDSVNHIILEESHSTGLIKGVKCGVLRPGETIQKILFLHSTGTAGDRILDISVQCQLPSLDATEDAQSHVSPRSASNISETLQTLSISTLSPLGINSEVAYRLPVQSSRDPTRVPTALSSYDNSVLENQAEGIVRTTITNLGPWDIIIEKSTFTPATIHENIKLLNCSLDTEESDFPMRFLAGDNYCIVLRFVVLAKDPMELEEILPSPGMYEIQWTRAQELSNKSDMAAITRISLPQLSVSQDSMVALLELPAAGVPHLPITIKLRLRNHHPWRTADIHLQLEPSDNFVVSGLRSGNLPVLLAGSEESLSFNIIPVSCGIARLPTFKLFDRRKETQERQSHEGAEGARIPTIDSRVEERSDGGEEVRLIARVFEDDGSSRSRRIDAEGLSLFITPV